MILAMHMANELLTVPVAAATLCIGAAAVAVAATKARRNLDSERLPLMGVMGAFVFAAQMINFSLPGMPGTSGHLGGGVLLAILLGPAAAIVTMAGILIIQCLLFQDGGLLALGCNIINMGVVPCLVGWAAYRLLLGPAGKAAAWRQYLAAWAACLAGVVGGAALVPVETMAAGVLPVPLGLFMGVMLGVHLIIALVEGLITFAVIAYLRRARPAALGLPVPEPGVRQSRLSRPALAASILVTALLLAGLVSHFASAKPDGLEWSWSKMAQQSGAPEVRSETRKDEAVAKVDQMQQRLTPMPDYAKDAGAGWASLAGVAGTLITLAAVYGASRLIRRRAVQEAARPPGSTGF